MVNPQGRFEQVHLLPPGVREGSCLVAAALLHAISRATYILLKHEEEKCANNFRNDLQALYNNDGCIHVFVAEDDDDDAAELVEVVF